MVRKGSKKEKELRHKARRLNIKEGILWTFGDSLGYNYISPFAIAVNASNSLVAMISSLVGLISPLGQIIGSNLMEKHSRKKIFLKTRFFSSLTWIPLIIIAILFYKGIIVNLLPLAVLLFFSFYVALSSILIPAWFSWAGDIVDKKYRGRWFAKRNLFTGIFTLILAVLAAVFLDYFKKQGWIMFGFGILFLLTFMTRFATLKIIKKEYEPKIKIKKRDYFSFWNFLIKAPKTNFGRFAIFRLFLSMANMVSFSVLAIYLLRFLGFSYTSYTLIILSHLFFSLFFIRLWGVISDIYGNYKVLCITSMLIPIIPILLILNTSVLYLISTGVVRGFAWSGFSLSERNFVYDNVEKSKRGLATSYYNMMGGIGIFLGAGIGAILIRYLKTSFIEPIILIFIIGAIARMIVVFIGMTKIKEVRKTEKLRNLKDFEEIILKETKPSLVEEAHEIFSIKKYIHTR
ncbi:major Facilitator Superfamily protein [archaeon BMS3Abin17]|nr:major Facilitator Superfamily protein [archaeon BMS3Abin17]HDZ61261.1 MFS transporter [Candidatus Pacearchaeota archaeon]